MVCGCHWRLVPLCSFPVGKEYRTNQNVPESPLEQFQAFLKQRGLRLTSERKAIAEIVFNLAPPFDVETLLGAVEQASSHISRSTVYRTLALLAASGLLTGGSLTRRLMTAPSPKEETPASLCISTHSKFIAGKCPWCGGDIIYGKLRGERE